MMRRAFRGGALLASLALTACPAMTKQEQLERVAKDWSLVIRASQFIPVLPLSEDIEPGDILLVQTPIDDQIKVYDEKGFLPLDKLLARLTPTGYSAFYKSSYGVGKGDSLPHQWQFPIAKAPGQDGKDPSSLGGTAPPPPPDRATPTTERSPVSATPLPNAPVDPSGKPLKDAPLPPNLPPPVVKVPAPPQPKDAKGTVSPPTDWDRAPHASFPSYSFSIQKGGGINLAVPVHGVPVGLSMIGASTATGTISIADGHTYGIDTLSLLAQVRTWASADDIKKFLSTLSPRVNPQSGKEEFYYVRVITRVYLAGSMNVSLTNDDTAGGSLSGGAPKPVDLFSAQKGDSGDNYTKTLDSVNTALNSIGTNGTAIMPGGTLKVAAASSSSISMIETFPRPLVVGYLAFELPILEKGELGDLEFTHAKLSGTPRIKTSGQVISDWIRGNPENRAKLRAWLDKLGHEKDGITNVLFGLEFEDLRKKAIHDFGLQ